jgi:hypothetical protein
VACKQPTVHVTQQRTCQLSQLCRFDSVDSNHCRASLLPWVHNCP